MRGSDISAECKSVDIRASNADRPCTHRHAYHIGPRTHAGIEQDGRVAGCGYYRRQHVNCSPFLHSLDVRHDWNSRSHLPRNQSHDAHRRDGICLSRSAATLLLTSTRACLPTLILFRTLHTKAVPRPWCWLLQFAQHLLKNWVRCVVGQHMAAYRGNSRLRGHAAPAGIPRVQAHDDSFEAPPPPAGSGSRRTRCPWVNKAGRTQACHPA